MSANLAVLVEYVGRDVQKSQQMGTAKAGSLTRAINATHKKFNGAENLFLGQGKIEFTKEQLRKAYVESHVGDYVKKYGGNLLEGATARRVWAGNWDIPEGEFSKAVNQKLGSNPSVAVAATSASSAKRPESRKPSATSVGSIRK